MITIQELEQRIVQRRQEISDYEKEVEKVENADDYDHPYWQGLTDELGWERDELNKDLHLLEELKKAQ